MRVLLRLGLWGAAATIALGVAVVAASSGTGSRRLVAALEGRDAIFMIAQSEVPPTSAEPSAAELATRAAEAKKVATRLAEAEKERQRLADTVRRLSTDRDQLLARMASLEHSLQDVTGSIKGREAVPTPAPSPVASALPAPVASTAPTPTPMPPPSPLPAQNAPVVESAAPMPPKDNAMASQEAAEPVAPKPKQEAAVDIGGAISFDGLRALWRSVTRAHAALFEGLEPLVIVRENSHPRGIELRLIAGPMADAKAAAHLCAALTAVRRFCHPTEFEGQKLSVVAPEAERRTPAASERRSPNASRQPIRRP